eukprot:SAG31_NODE_11182_length_1057_cov_3.132568_1_plen_200_part_01
MVAVAAAPHAPPPLPTATVDRAPRIVATTARATSDRPRVAPPHHAGVDCMVGGAVQDAVQDVVLVSVETHEDRERAARDGAMVLDDEADGPGVLAAQASGPQARAALADDSGATKVTVKTEDGGWTAEFQPLRQKRFDEKEYARLHELFFAEYTVEAGVRESRTRRGTLRTTVRETGTTTRIAKWPRLQNVVQQLHEDGN